MRLSAPSFLRVVCTVCDSSWKLELHIDVSGKLWYLNVQCCANITVNSKCQDVKMLQQLCRRGVSIAAGSCLG
jgi:hypothetical protein